jgi:hypothetical protein
MTTKSKGAKGAKKAAKKAKSAQKSKAAGKLSASAAYSTATSPKKAVKERVAAMSQVALAAVKNDNNPQALLSILRNRDEPVEVRLSALQQLAAASFSAEGFETWRGDYIVTLREVATDTDTEIRQRALGFLARENDGFAEKKLLEGLQHPDKALVPPEKALQLLGYNVHAEAYSVAREIVEKPPNADAKREALRLLAADPKSAPLFEKILLDKDELRENRQISASALHALKPDKFQEHARDILLDKAEYDDIQATALTALTQFGDEAAIAEDKPLLTSIDRLSAGKAPSKYKQSARRFLSKYGK